MATKSDVIAMEMPSISPTPKTFTRNNASMVNTRPEVKTVLLTNREVASDLLDGLRLAGREDVSVKQEPENIVPIPSRGDVPPISISDKMFCSYCQLNFINRNHQKHHYKTDWHRYNLRQMLKGLLSISEDKFEELLAGDISSISGSDSSDSSDDEDNENEKRKNLVLPEPLMCRRANAESDSDSEDEKYIHIEGIGHRHPRVFMRTGSGQLISIYRCVVHSKKNQPEDQHQLISMVTALPLQTKWVVFMTAGGHFAAAVFDGAEVVAHKTFHRYTVRAKRGTAQGSHDKQGNAAQSAGASLRRYNEAALSKEVAELIELWMPHIKSCDRIFLRAPSGNRALFFGGKTPPLDKKDLRIRLIPFPTRRPTFNELRRVHGILTSIVCHGDASTIHDHIQPIKRSPVKSKALAQDKPKQVIVTSNEYEEDSDSDNEGLQELVTMLETTHTDHLNPYMITKHKKRRKKYKEPNKEVHQDGHGSIIQENHTDFSLEDHRLRNELYTACKVGDFVRLKESLSPLLPNHTQPAEQSQRCDDMRSQSPVEATTNADKNDCIVTTDVTGNAIGGGLTMQLLNGPFGESGQTLLHVAAAQDQAAVVLLLLEAGADPTIRDCNDKVPYLMATQKSVRNQFRQFMGSNPDRHDYTVAQIPAPVSPEREAEKKAKDAERRKAAKKARNARLKDKRAEDAEKAAEKREQDRYIKLSDREKRALAAERRLVSQLNTEGKESPTLSRCWQCGIDITGKIPFEYFDYKFCTPKCLKDHKLSQKKS